MAFLIKSSDDNDIIAEFNKKFGILKAKLTNHEKYLNKVDFNEHELRSRCTAIEHMFDDFNSLVQSFTEKTTDENLQTVQNSIDDYTDRYHSLIGKLYTISESKFEEQKNNSLTSSHGDLQKCNNDHFKPQPQSIRLPEIKIPYFDGSDPTEWITFRDTFIAVVHNNDNIDEILKFTILLDKLKGNAKAAIGHITLTKAGYESAWESLKNLYDDIRIIIDKHVESLLDLEPITKRNEVNLRKLLNSSLSHVSSLNACGYDLNDLSQIMLLKIVTRKLDQTTRGEWEESIEMSEKPSWKKFQEFLERKCRVLHEVEKTGVKPSTNISVTKPQFNSKNYSKSSYNKSKPNSSFFVNKTQHESKCDLCSKAKHPYFMCPTFNDLNPQQRYQKIKEIGACLNCLNPHHKTTDCKSQGCKICRGNHHTLLHFDQSKPQNTTTTLNQTQSTPTSVTLNNTTTSSYYASNELYEKQTILPTVILKVEDHIGRKVKCRALLDSGSQSNFMSENLLKQLKLNKTNNIFITITGLNGSKSQVSQSIQVSIHSNYKPFSAKLEFSITKTISDRLPFNTFNISRWQIPPEICLSDPTFNVSNPIDMLIGAELFPEILLSNKIKLSQKLPVIQESVFGWVVFGNFEQRIEHNFSAFETNEKSNENHELDQAIKKFWEMENLPNKKFLSDEEKACENYFLQTTKRDPTGRYIVSIPFRDNLNELGESKSHALKRFHSLERKLNTNALLKKPYVDFINEYFELDHMKLAENDDNLTEIPTYYLPHHAVLRPSSTSTKLRVVFDASAKTTSSKSLNEMMLVGPTVQDSLFDIVLRFRKHKFAMSCDISKMYRQILISENETRLQRILWRENINDPILTFELKTVTYGTASAPYLATRVLNQLATDETDNFPIASKVASKDFYVDDLITGCDDLNQAIELQREMIELLSKGGFHLHKWCSNDDCLLNEISPQDREELKYNEFSLGSCIKALGLLWQPKEDIFVFKPPTFSNEDSLTKRSVVSDVAKLYDPLGFLSPIIITGKIIVQSLWNLKIDWDEKLPEDIQQTWITYRQNLESIVKIQLERNVKGHRTSTSIVRTELHGFSDASEMAFGACLYVKTVDNNNKVSVKLLCSKSRVAPLKTLSLPRLELSAALLLSKLVESAVEALNIKFDDVILWSDSTITLCWIKTSPHKLKSFIANRVNEIQELTINYTWKHIDSPNNPADLVSRGIMPNDIINSDMWWYGPDILKGNDYESIMTQTVEDFDPKIFELKPEQNICLLSTSPPDFFNRALKSFESFYKCIRVIAFMLRYSYRLRKRKTTTYLPLNEIDKALKLMIKSVQQDAFKDELKSLNNSENVGNKSCLRFLNPFLDDDGIIRVGGRLSNMQDLNYDQKHQILIPSKHEFTKSLFRYEHNRNFHAGPQLLLSLIRQKYWPISGKVIAKQTVRFCVTCFRTKPKTTQQLMGNLPIERLSTPKAFYNTGVDYCGPFFIKLSNHRKAIPQKMYVASFVCMCTKAIHLEIVQDQTTDSFISCLKRFVARRGLVSTIWSDNASTFQGAKKDLSELHHLLSDQLEQNKVTDYCTAERIYWKFIPPRSPNFGGLWEASIKSFKTHLKRIMKNQTMNFDKFFTLVVQIEGILNSRPISNMSDDPNDPEPLTPSHFLTGGPTMTVSEPDYNHIPENRLSKWQKISKMVDSFWKRYSREYLHKLQTRSKWNSTNENIKPGDVVLLVKENFPPAKWPLAIVASVFPGLDNKVRVVELQVMIDGVRRTFKRSISKICKLPITC